MSPNIVLPSAPKIGRKGELDGVILTRQVALEASGNKTNDNNDDDVDGNNSNDNNNINNFNNNNNDSNNYNDDIFSFI